MNSGIQAGLSLAILFHMVSTTVTRRHPAGQWVSLSGPRWLHSHVRLVGKQGWKAEFSGDFDERTKSPVNKIEAT